MIQAKISVEDDIRHIKTASQFFIVFSKSFDVYFS